VVKVRTDRGEKLFAWPQSIRLAHGVPVHPSSGDPFAVRRFKSVDAFLGGLPQSYVLQGVSVHVFDAHGKHMVREDFGS
jgi:hypothetical protein